MKFLLWAGWEYAVDGIGNYVIGLENRTVSGEGIKYQLCGSVPILFVPLLMVGVNPPNAAGVY